MLIWVLDKREDASFHACVGISFQMLSSEPLDCNNFYGRKSFARRSLCFKNKWLGSVCAVTAKGVKIGQTANGECSFFFLYRQASWLLSL